MIMVQFYKVYKTWLWTRLPTRYEGFCGVHLSGYFSYLGVLLTGLLFIMEIIRRSRRILEHKSGGKQELIIGGTESDGYPE